MILGIDIQLICKKCNTVLVGKVSDICGADVAVYVEPCSCEIDTKDTEK